MCKYKSNKNGNFKKRIRRIFEHPKYLSVIVQITFLEYSIALSSKCKSQYRWISKIFWVKIKIVDPNVYTHTIYINLLKLKFDIMYMCIYTVIFTSTFNQN